MSDPQVSPAEEAAPQAIAPAPAVEASETVSASAPKKVGFMASLLGSGQQVADLQARLEAEQAAHAQTNAQLAAASARVAEFESLEAQLEAQANAAQTAAAEAATAQAEAQAQLAAAEAQVPEQVAAQVAATVEALGVDLETLPAAQSEPAAKGNDFAHLKGLARAAAAFNSQLSKA